MNPRTEAIHGRYFAADLPGRGLHPGEAKVLARVLHSVPGDAFCDVWDTSDRHGMPITFAFVARARLERRRAAANT